jgi:hypothetical protein
MSDAAADFDIAGDKLIGAVQIAEFIDEPIKKTFRLLSKKQLPPWKRGGEWIASKSALREHYARMTRGAAGEA